LLVKKDEKNEKQKETPKLDLDDLLAKKDEKNEKQKDFNVRFKERRITSNSPRFM